MLNRHIGFYGEAPRQTAADGGFASRHNLSEAKALRVRDVAFHKKAGLRVMDIQSNWSIASFAGNNLQPRCYRSPNLGSRFSRKAATASR